MKFIISPRWHSRCEGDYIQFSDTMYFQNVTTKYYLTVYRNESITKSLVARTQTNQNINVDTAILSLAMQNSCKIKDENPYVPEKNIIVAQGGAGDLLIAVPDTCFLYTSPNLIMLFFVTISKADINVSA